MVQHLILALNHHAKVHPMNYARNHLVYAPSQWEMTLHCYVIFHWLGAYTKWSLHAHNSHFDMFWSGVAPVSFTQSATMTSLVQGQPWGILVKSDRNPLGTDNTTPRQCKTKPCAYSWVFCTSGNETTSVVWHNNLLYIGISQKLNPSLRGICKWLNKSKYAWNIT